MLALFRNSVAPYWKLHGRLTYEKLFLQAIQDKQNNDNNSDKNI